MFWKARKCPKAGSCFASSSRNRSTKGPDHTEAGRGRADRDKVSPDHGCKKRKRPRPPWKRQSPARPHGKGLAQEEQDQALADLVAAQSVLDLATKNFDRIEKLNFQVSPMEYDNAANQLKTARAKYNSAMARKRMVVDAGSREEDRRETEATYQQALAHHQLLQAGSR